MAALRWRTWPAKLHLPMLTVHILHLLVKGDIHVVAEMLNSISGEFTTHFQLRELVNILH